MTRIERSELVDKLELMVLLHEEKAIYYRDWLDSEQLKLNTIGFNIADNYLVDTLNEETVVSHHRQIEGDETFRYEI